MWPTKVLSLKSQSELRLRPDQSCGTSATRICRLHSSVASFCAASASAACVSAAALACAAASFRGTEEAGQPASLNGHSTGARGHTCSCCARCDTTPPSPQCSHASTRCSHDAACSSTARRCTHLAPVVRARHWRVPALVVTHCRQRSTVEGNVPQNSCVLRQRETILFVRQRIRHTPSSSVKHVRIRTFVTACPFFWYALYHGTDRADRAKNGSQLILPCPGIPCFLPRVCCLSPCVCGYGNNASCATEQCPKAKTNPTPLLLQ